MQNQPLHWSICSDDGIEVRYGIVFSYNNVNENDGTNYEQGSLPISNYIGTKFEKLQVKDVGHIWELGGGTNFCNLLQIPLTSNHIQ